MVFPVKKMSKNNLALPCMHTREQHLSSLLHIWPSPPSWLSWAVPVQTSFPPSPSSRVWSETSPDRRCHLHHLRRGTHQHDGAAGTNMTVWLSRVCRHKCSTRVTFAVNLLGSAGAVHSYFLTSTLNIKHFLLVCDIYSAVVQVFFNEYEDSFICITA